MRHYLFLIISIFFIGNLKAQFPVNTSKGSIALNGYDLISYFEGEATQGNKKYTALYNGVTYYFDSVNHLQAFNTSPTKYLPEYGGYCAYAMAESGKLVDVNPKSFLIINNKLYLFYDAWGVNTRKKWLQKSESHQIISADNYWDQLKN